MMAARHELNPDKIALYRATAQRRAEEVARIQIKRRELAWEVAYQAAAYLKSHFGARQVVAFGSLVHGHWFSATSDIDLAASGLQNEDYFTAVARLQDLSPDFQIDLVPLERCRATLRETILREGRVL
jgi:predicted nucleotidyltransferase